MPPAEAGKKQNWQVNMEDKVPEFLFKNVAQHCNRNISYSSLLYNYCKRTYFHIRNEAGVCEN